MFCHWMEIAENEWKVGCTGEVFRMTSPLELYEYCPVCRDSIMPVDPSAALNHPPPGTLDTLKWTVPEAITSELFVLT
jgi:hypothetical protein